MEIWWKANTIVQSLKRATRDATSEWVLTSLILLEQILQILNIEFYFIETYLWVDLPFKDDWTLMIDFKLSSSNEFDFLVHETINKKIVDNTNLEDFLYSESSWLTTQSISALKNYFYFLEKNRSDEKWTLLRVQAMKAKYFRGKQNPINLNLVDQFKWFV